MFYDKGYYSDGWRYLEAAPEDVRVGSVNVAFVCGWYKESKDGESLFVNGTTHYDESNCTGLKIGTGKTNTEKLVAAMGDAAYGGCLTSTYDGKLTLTQYTTDLYAAKVCDDYVYGGYDD